MAAFHVFVEGATDGSAAGLSRLADAIAKQYGLPAADLLARLKSGRFRVKGNIDRPAAETYVRDLEKLGARCVIEEATAANSQRATPIPFPAVKPPADITPPADTTQPLPTAPQRASTPPPVGGQQFQSGLSAAFSGEMPAADLGALGRTGAQFALSTVDGNDDQSPAPEGGSFGPPGGGLPASIGPAPERQDKPQSGQVAKVKDEPLDMFAPPEMQGEEPKFDLAADEKDPRGRMGTPPPVEEPAARPSSKKIPTTPAPASGRISKPVMQAQSAPVDVIAPSSNRFGMLGEPRNRLVAGVFLAVILGFVPAHFVAKMKEESSYEAIDRKVIAAQQQADTADTYANLDRMRADQLDRKKSEQRNAAFIGFAIWALVGAGIAYAFFKKIPWDA